MLMPTPLLLCVYCDMCFLPSVFLSPFPSVASVSFSFYVYCSDVVSPPTCMRIYHLKKTIRRSSIVLYLYSDDDDDDDQLLSLKLYLLPFFTVGVFNFSLSWFDHTKIHKTTIVFWIQFCGPPMKNVDICDPCMKFCLFNEIGFDWDAKRWRWSLIFHYEDSFRLSKCNVQSKEERKRMQWERDDVRWTTIQFSKILPLCSLQIDRILLNDDSARHTFWCLKHQKRGAAYGK